MPNLLRLEFELLQLAFHLHDLRVLCPQLALNGLHFLLMLRFKSIHVGAELTLNLLQLSLVLVLYLLGNGVLLH